MWLFMIEQVVFWIMIAAIAVLVECCTLGLTTIWVGLSAVVAMILAFLNVSFVIQVVVFSILTVIQIILFRPLARKIFNFEKTDTNYTQIIGAIGFVTENINSAEGKGRVSVNGADWKAKSENIIKKGTKVKVVSISGASLIVKPL